MRNSSPCGFLKFVLPLVAICFVSAAAHAQILQPVRADIHHPFTVGSTTLPAGHYTFQVKTSFENSMMTITSANGKRSVQTLVRPSQDAKTPRHTQLVFTRQGDQELLHHIYVAGNQYGLTVVQPSRDQALLQASQKQQDQQSPSVSEQAPSSSDSSVGRM